ncbi:MAG TPA: ParB N-terminal domain-containing protein, partial [bacterium]|nr:ParB N-terminal domain-containing protein [bacterium]
MPLTELRPTLRLVPTARIRFHENPERRRTERLMARIKQDALLRNPPIVATMPGEDYLLLDGANRVSAFRELGHDLVPVQLVDYGSQAIQLKGWHHLLVDGRALNLKSQYGMLRGVALQKVPREQLGPLLEFRRIYAALVDESYQAWGLFPQPPGRAIPIHQRIETLNQIISCYEGQSKLERIKLVDYSKLPEVLRTVEHQLCLFPVLTKEELLQLTQDGVMLPTGITRHLIPGRALGL